MQAVVHQPDQLILQSLEALPHIRLYGLRELQPKISQDLLQEHITLQSLMLIYVVKH